MRQTKPFTVEVRRKRRAKKTDAGSIWCAPETTAEASRGKGEQEGKQEGTLEEPEPEGDSGERLQRPCRE